MFKCIQDRYDPNGDIVYDSLEDFMKMCTDNGWDEPMMYRDGIWYRLCGTNEKILEEV